MRMIKLDNDEKKEISNRNRVQKWGTIGLITGLVLGGIDGYLIGSSYLNPHIIGTFPKSVEGYVQTSDIRIGMDNLLNNGEYYPVMTYHGKDYLMEIGKDGVPTMVPYTVKTTLEEK